MACSSIRAVAVTASSRRRRTTSFPTALLAQESFLNQEVTSCHSLSYHPFDFSPLRPRGFSASHVSRLRGEDSALARAAQSDEEIIRGKTSTISTLVKAGEGHQASRRRSSASRPSFSLVLEEDDPDEVKSVDAVPQANGTQSGGDFRQVGRRRPKDEEEDEVRHEYTRLLPHRKLGKHGSGRHYGSLESTSSSSNGVESNTSDVTNTDETSLGSDEFGNNDKVSNEKVKFTRRQWVVLSVLMTATLTSSFAVCLFPPFYPRLAEEKGSSAAIYGFVIGTNCLTSFLVTPVIGKNLPNFGVLYSMVLGTFIGGMCCAVSGFLEFFPPGWCFVFTSSLIRIVHATGNALVITATFTYTAMEFQQAVGKIFSLTRTAMNLGQLLGPLVGGALYQSGGFYLPFVTMGALQATMGLISLVALKEIPVMCNESRDPRRTNEKKITILNILSIPTIWFSFVTFIVATICNGFLSINLEPKVLRQFHLTPFWVGLVFGIKDGANSLSSPMWGYLCDKSRKTSVKPYLVVSSLLVTISFILMGGGSVFGMDVSLNLPMLIFLLCLNGIGIGGEQVVGVVDAHHEAANAGYPDDPAMHGIIAGLWSSLSGAGRFVSRAGSGILIVCIGFDSTAAIVASFQGIIAVLTLCYMIFCECSLKKQRSVHWDDVTLIEGSNDELVFTESASPSESLMVKTVSIDIPKRSGKLNYRLARSLPPQKRRNRGASHSGVARSLLP